MFCLRRAIFLLVLLVPSAQGQATQGQGLELVQTHLFNQANPSINEDVQIIANGYIAYTTSNEGNHQLHVENIFSPSEQKTLTLEDGLLSAKLATYSWYDVWLVKDAFDYSLLFYDNGIQQEDEFRWAEDGLAMPLSAVTSLEGLIASAYGFPDATISVYSVFDKREIARLEGHHQAFVHSIAFASEANPTLASADDDGKLILWNYDVQSIITELDFSDNFIDDITFSANGDRLFVLQDLGLGKPDKIVVIDAYTGEMLQTINDVYGEKLLAQTKSASGTEGVVLAVSAESITWIDDRSGEVIEVFDNGGQALHEHSILDVAVNWLDASQLITVSADDTVKVWARSDGSPVVR